jgi:hypothetical protein
VTLGLLVGLFRDRAQTLLREFETVREDFFKALDDLYLF